jgi:hypothetical protein
VRSHLVFILALTSACDSPVRLGVLSCGDVGGECASYPTGCPCGQWDQQASCGSGALVCCLPRSCAPSDLGRPPACLPTGSACSTNAQCCNNDCAAATNTCSDGTPDLARPPVDDACAASGGQCVPSEIDCPRGHIVGPPCGLGGDVAGRCCVPGTANVPCGSATCGANQVCLSTCGGGTNCLQPPCPGTPVCVDLPSTCDPTSQATACACFATDPCPANGGGSCTGNIAPGQVECFCPPTSCDAPTVTAFVDAHNSCTQASDCVALCTLGATCDLRGVNRQSATLFQQMFGSCSFPACALACGPPACSANKCM